MSQPHFFVLPSLPGKAFYEWVTSTNNRPLCGLVRCSDDPHTFQPLSVSLLPSSAPLQLTSTASANLSLVLWCTVTTSSLVLLSPPPPNWSSLYPIWEATILDEWLYNGVLSSWLCFTFSLGILRKSGREWELSYRLGISPWICVAYSAPTLLPHSVPCLSFWSR